MNTDYKKLYKKYQALLDENRRLKLVVQELELKSEFGFDFHDSSKNQEMLLKASSHNGPEIQTNIIPDIKTTDLNAIHNLSSVRDKIAIFMSLFKGRSDVYAKMWKNQKGGSGYSPVCLNEWEAGICKKPSIKCSRCSQRLLGKLDSNVIERHLRGESVIGIYPICEDDSCYFLAIDFDNEGWQKDISILQEVCQQFEIPLVVERSKSGNGAHAWFFFETKVPAILARKGT